MSWDNSNEDDPMHVNYDDMYHEQLELWHKELTEECAKLKSKYAAAQKEIADLRSKLEQEKQRTIDAYCESHRLSQMLQQANGGFCGGWQVLEAKEGT